MCWCELTTKKISKSYKLGWSAMLVLDYSSRSYQIFGWQGQEISLEKSVPFELEGGNSIEKLMKDRKTEPDGTETLPFIEIQSAGSSLNSDTQPYPPP